MGAEPGQPGPSPGNDAAGGGGSGVEGRDPEAPSGTQRGPPPPAAAAAAAAVAAAVVVGEGEGGRQVPEEPMEQAADPQPQEHAENPGEAPGQQQQQRRASGAGGSSGGDGAAAAAQRSGSRSDKRAEVYSIEFDSLVYSLAWSVSVLWLRGALLRGCVRRAVEAR